MYQFFSNLVLVVSEVGEEMKNHFKSLKQYKVRECGDEPLPSLAISILDFFFCVSSSDSPLAASGDGCRLLVLMIATDLFLQKSSKCL
jgi:hypothetical protein